MNKRSPGGSNLAALVGNNNVDIEVAMSMPKQKDESQVLLLDGSDKPSPKLILGIPVALFSGAAYCSSSMGMVREQAQFAKFA